MKFGLRIFATMAVSFLLMPALRADDAKNSAPSAGNDGAVSSSLAPAGEATSAAPTPTLAIASEDTLAPTDPTPAPEPQAKGRGGDNNTPRIELFGGYSYWRALPPYPVNRIAWMHGGSMSFAYNFTKYLGLVGDFGGYNDTRFSPGPPSTPVGSVVSSSGDAFSFLAGPRFSFRTSRVTPFVQVLFGAVHASPVSLNGCTSTATGSAANACTPLLSENTFAMTAGGGVDLKVSRHVAIRLVQAEYLLTRFADASAMTGDRVIQNNMRLSTGIVFSFGSVGPPPAPAAAACSAQPAEVFAGEPVSATATGSNFNRKRTIQYKWSGTGVTVAGSTASTQVNTTGLQPGSYRISASLTDGTKNGLASCMAGFDVKRPPPPPIAPNRPPTVSLAPDRNPVLVGERVVFTATASDPDGDPLTYTWSTNGGQLSPGAAMNIRNLDTTGVTPGLYTVTVRVEDGRGGSADASAGVQVNAPPVVVPPQANRISGCDFTALNGARVDNVCKRVLDDVALRLKNDPRATVVIVGFADPRERRPDQLAGNRGGNAVKYLTAAPNGVDASRITTRTGAGQVGAGQANRRIDIIWVPQGATY